MIDLAGMAPGLEPGKVSQSVLQSLGWFTMVMVSSLALLAAWYFTRLRLSRADHARVTLQLADRAAMK